MQGPLRAGSVLTEEALQEIEWLETNEEQQTSRDEDRPGDRLGVCS
jgi:hypothetical protein